MFYQKNPQVEKEQNLRCFSKSKPIGLPNINRIQSFLLISVYIAEREIDHWPGSDIRREAPWTEPKGNELVLHWHFPTAVHLWGRAQRGDWFTTLLGANTQGIPGTFPSMLLRIMLGVLLIPNVLCEKDSCVFYSFKHACIFYFIFYINCNHGSHQLPRDGLRSE